ncbi:MAG: ribosomal protein S18-alanine N-acetyltransferase [Pseudomonadota bacterium]
MSPEALAALHRLCFTDAPPPWTAKDFEELLGQPGVILLTHPNGFILLRSAADEAEVLTLAVDPTHRRKGIAQALLDQSFEHLAGHGITEVFLEVAVDNAPAQSLYTKCGFKEVARRPRFYRSGADAIVMRVTVTEVS